MQVTEGGGGKGGWRAGSYFADFLSTAAVWCVPFCLDCHRVRNQVSRISPNPE